MNDNATKQKVLIVDDAPENIHLIIQALENKYAVITALNGEAALRLAATEPFPDIILLDIVMPGMDGYEVFEKLKMNDLTASIPVIFVTALGDVGNELKGLEMGAADFISKPIRPPIVKARVRTHLLIKSQQDGLKKSISRLQHEAEMLQQKADLGIQAGGLVHDIHNILQGVLFVSAIPELIPQDLPQKDDVLAFVELAQDYVRLSEEICNGYNDYLTDVGENSKVQSIVPLLKPLTMFANQYKGTLEYDIAPDVPLVNCKGYQLKRAFVNLFVNASQALEKKAEKKIVVRVWSKDDRVFFSITDNGTGIPEQVLPRIFEERYTTKPQGSGIGLFLVRQIVSSHQGKVTVDSEIDKGTTFTLSFPAIGAQAP